MLNTLFFKSPCFLNEEAYKQGLEIYRSTYDQPGGPLLDIRDYGRIIEDTFQEWMEQNTIPLSLRVDGTLLEINRGLYGMPECLFEITSAQRPIETEVARKLIEAGLNISNLTYRRIVRAREINNTLNNRSMEAITRILGNYNLFRSNNISEPDRDLFMLENMVR